MATRHKENTRTAAKSAKKAAGRTPAKKAVKPVKAAAKKAASKTASKAAKKHVAPKAGAKNTAKKVAAKSVAGATKTTRVGTTPAGTRSPAGERKPKATTTTSLPSPAVERPSTTAAQAVRDRRSTGRTDMTNTTRRTTNGRPPQRDPDAAPVDFNGRNMALFARRIEARTELDALGENPRGVRQQMRARQLRSELNDIDTAIIELNYGLVLDYVRKFTSTTSREDSRDFEGAAVLGLMRAIATYDPTRGSKFSTWAYKPIQRECLRAVRDADFKHLNPGDFEKRPEILRAVRTLTKGDTEAPQPSYEAIAAEANATFETVKRVLTAQEQESLYRPVGDGEDSYLVDLIRDPEGEIEDMILARQEVSDLEEYGLSALDERELFVIGRRFGLDAEPPQRLSTIGVMLGLSREAVRQVEAKALSKLNHPLVLRKMVLMGRK